MTRKEEIEQYCAEQGFPYGACASILSINAITATDAIKWADKTMIEKVCKYLKTHLYQGEDADFDPIVKSIHNITLDNFIKDIKRYLEK